MKDIKKPEFMLEAMRGRRGFIAVLEILIAIVVFVVSSIAMSIGTIPLMIGYFVSDPEFMKTAQSVADGSMDSLQYMQKMQDYALHLPDWMTIATLLLEILMIAVVFVYCRFLEKRKIRTLGFRKKGMVPQYLKGAVAGALFFSVAYLICVLTGSIHVEGLVTNMAPLGILGYLVGYLVQGMAEEVLCRGYLFVSLSRRHSVVYSAVLSALFFAMLHGANSGLTPLAVFNLFLFGIFAALLLVKCENIWVVGAFHSLWNFAQGNIYGIQVSGNSLQPAILNSSNVKGHGLINGAGFGLEGGLGVTLVLGLGIAYLVYNLNKQGKIVEWEGFRPVGENYNNDMPSGQIMQVHSITEISRIMQVHIITEISRIMQVHSTTEMSRVMQVHSMAEKSRITPVRNIMEMNRVTMVHHITAIRKLLPDRRKKHSLVRVQKAMKIWA